MATTLDQYDAKSLETLKGDIKDILLEASDQRLYNYKLKNKIEWSDENPDRPWNENTGSRILSFIRDDLDEKNIISVEEDKESGNSPFPRKIWILEDEEALENLKYYDEIEDGE